MQPKDQYDTLALSHDLRRHIAQGLYTHSRLNANTSRTLEAMSFLYALIELLEEKGLITIAELDARNGSWGSGWWIDCVRAATA